jgi:hypothetical protein
MKWKPIEGAIKGRENFFWKEENGLIRVWRGNPNDIEDGEFIMQTSVSLIPGLIATLRLIQESVNNA